MICLVLRAMSEWLTSVHSEWPPPSLSVTPSPPVVMDSGRDGRGREEGEREMMIEVKLLDEKLGKFWVAD